MGEHIINYTNKHQKQNENIPVRHNLKRYKITTTITDIGTRKN